MALNPPPLWGYARRKQGAPENVGFGGDSALAIVFALADPEVALELRGGPGHGADAGHLQQVACIVSNCEPTVVSLCRTL